MGYRGITKTPCSSTWARYYYMVPICLHFKVNAYTDSPISR